MNIPLHIVTDMNVPLYVVTDNNNQEQLRTKIEHLIGANTLKDILEDVVGSAQAMIEDVYADDPKSEKRVANLFSGDPTSDACLIWVKDPQNGMAYSVKMEFTFHEQRPI